MSSMDKDGNGKLTKEEIKEACKQLDTNMTDAEVDELIKKHDKDGDGRIDYKEFCAMINS